MKPSVIIRLSPKKDGYALRMEMRVTENRTTTTMVGRSDVRDMKHGLRLAEFSIAGLWRDLRASCAKRGTAGSAGEQANGGGASAGPTKAGGAA